MNQSQRQDPDHDHDHDQHQDRGQIQDQTSTQSLASSEVHNQSQEQSQSQSSHTFAEVADYSKWFSPNFHMLDHKPEVRPIFLGFKRVAREGYKIPLIQVVAAVGDVVGKQNVDAVQPMRSGWQIYAEAYVCRD